MAYPEKTLLNCQDKAIWKERLSMREKTTAKSNLVAKSLLQEVHVYKTPLWNHIFVWESKCFSMKYCIVKNWTTKGSQSNTHTETHNTPYPHSSVCIVCVLQALSLHFFSLLRDHPKHVTLHLLLTYWTGFEDDTHGTTWGSCCSSSLRQGCHIFAHSDKRL